MTFFLNILRDTLYVAKKSKQKFYISWRVFFFLARFAANVSFSRHSVYRNAGASNGDASSVHDLQDREPVL